MGRATATERPTWRHARLRAASRNTTTAIGAAKMSAVSGRVIAATAIDIDTMTSQPGVRASRQRRSPYQASRHDAPVRVSEKNPAR